MKILASLVLFVLLVFPALVFAEDARACVYSFQCGQGFACEAGECNRLDFQPTEGAEAMCGADRRCRIERMKRLNANRRQVQIAEDERIARARLVEIEAEKEGPQIRLDSPLSVDWRASRAGALGFAAGYTLTRSLKIEGQAFFWEGDYYGGNYRFYELNYLSLSGIYFTHGSPLAGYVSAGFMYGFGDSSGDFFSDAEEIVSHALDLQLGVDVQFERGFHTRLGIGYRPLIYHRAAISPGVYPPDAEDAFEDWHSDNVMLDVIFLVGWAF